jgi:predicted AAA+ superfamily ATPase
VGKRLVKAPKIYVSDSGVLHTLLGIRTRLELLAHPKLGSSWEGFALDQTLRVIDRDAESYFYRTQAGAELDLLVVKGRLRYGFEFKYEDAPRATKSMHVALTDLRLTKLWVVSPGEREYALAERISVLPLAAVSDAVRASKLQ